MSNELKVTKDAVLKAAESCSTAKSVLKTLFPDVFGENFRKFNYKERGSLNWNDSIIIINTSGEKWIIAFLDGNSTGTEFQLSPDYNWEIIESTGSIKTLKPTKK